jgi:hypothetical protein
VTDSKKLLKIADGFCDLLVLSNTLLLDNGFCRLASLSISYALDHTEGSLKGSYQSVVERIEQQMERNRIMAICKSLGVEEKISLDEVINKLNK